MKFLSDLTITILNHILNSELTEKIATVGGGIFASMFTFMNSGFSSFILKCFSAVIFAFIGASSGFVAKKVCQKVFNKYFDKDKKLKNKS